VSDSLLSPLMPTILSELEVWAAVGQAPNGQVQSNGVKFGAALAANGGKASVKIDDHALVGDAP
jgi:hypothetical protein